MTGFRNAFLAEQTRTLQRRLRPFRQAQLTVGNRIAQSMREHSAILRALEAGDGMRAAEAMRDHILVQGDLYEEFRLTRGADAESETDSSST